MEEPLPQYAHGASAAAGVAPAASPGGSPRGPSRRRRARGCGRYSPPRRRARRPPPPRRSRRCVRGRRAGAPSQPSASSAPSSCRKMSSWGPLSALLYFITSPVMSHFGHAPGAGLKLLDDATGARAARGGTGAFRRSLTTRASLRRRRRRRRTSTATRCCGWGTTGQSPSAG